jgi:hypothetical protein
MSLRSLLATPGIPEPFAASLVACLVVTAIALLPAGAPSAAILALALLTGLTMPQSLRGKRHVPALRWVAQGCCRLATATLRNPGSRGARRCRVARPPSVMPYRRGLPSPHP